MEKWNEGDSRALHELVPLIYKELRLLAKSHLRRQAQSVVLQPTALVHEAYLRLADKKQLLFKNRAHLKDAPSKHWTALGLGVTKSHGERIPALPCVMEEMHGIIREAGAGSQSGVLPGVIKPDEAFTQEAMLAGLRQRPPVVHVASHFQFSPGNEINSALLLGDGSFLSLAQIKSLLNVFGGVELLTLSACNIATGGSGANGTLGDPYLIFPTTRTRNGDNQVTAGRLIEIPAQDDRPNFFTLQQSRLDQTGEYLTVIVSSKPLAELTITDKALKLSVEQVTKWEKEWTTQAERFEMVGGKGQTWTKAEQAAGADATRSLSQQDPPPQTIYRVVTKPGQPVLIKVGLQYRTLRAPVKAVK